MDKESLYELQKIDCNCNDCGYMKRNLNLYNESVKLHHQWQLDYFNTIRANLIKKAREWKYKKNDLLKWDALMTEAENMKFQFDKSTNTISFGTCTLFNKEVTFIPNVVQLDTQTCFKHRKDFNEKL